MADRLLGEHAGAYRIERLLGKGGMGRVYRATHGSLGFPAAVKVIAEHYAEDAELVERFFAEARTIAAFQHENVVRIFDLVRMPDGRPAIVMELVDGESLRGVMNSGVATLGSLLTLIADALTGLAAAHAAGIIHRDLKPENILVTAEGRAKLLDFGIAKHAGTPLRTQTGIVLGTPQYMAPEQIRGMPPSQSSDVYAMGVILFELACGRRPFDAATDFEVMRMHVETPAPLARTLRPNVHPALEAVIAGALAKSPDERFASAPALATALREVARQLPPEQQPRPVQTEAVVPTTPATPRTVPTVSIAPTPPPRRRRSPSKLLLALSAVAIGMLGGAVIASQITGGRAAIAAPAALVVPSSPPARMPPPPPARGEAPARRRATPLATLLDHAATVAHGLAADAVLVEYEATWTVGGEALALPESRVEVAFVVPSRQPALDPSLPANAQPVAECRLVVTLGRDRVEHAFGPGDCAVPAAARMTRCPLDWVLARAARKGMDLSLALDIELSVDDDAVYWSVSDAKTGARVGVTNHCALLADDQVVPTTLPPLSIRGGTESFTIPLNLDPVTFDPVAFIPTATQLARLMDPTAVLSVVSVEPLSPSGQMQWGAEETRVRYELGGAAWCSIVVMVSDDGGEVTVHRTIPGRDCRVAKPAPTCTRDQLIGRTSGPDPVSLYFERRHWFVTRTRIPGDYQQTEVTEPCTGP